MDLADLNPAQRQAVEHLDGPALILAGAGSGKTRVLTRRVAYLVERGVDPESIATLTFTKKAAKEMQERLDDLLGGLNTHGITCGTIHAICYRILRDYWGERGESYDVLAGYHQKRFMRDILEAPGRDNPFGLNWDCDLKLALGQISRWKTELIDPDQVALLVDDGEIDPLWHDLYTTYEQVKEQRHQIDLDDMLLRTYWLLAKEEAVCDRWQGQWQYLLVDEVQDNSMLQWLLVERLAEPENNLFLVGDPDQSVYRFRGARPDLLSDFARRHPDSAIIPLETNYRSLPYVVQLGNDLINLNPRKTPRQTEAVRRGAVAHPEVRLPGDETDEAVEIIRYLKQRAEAGLHWRDVGVLYRTNAQSQPIEDALIQAQIPYRVLGSAGFWARRAVKDLMAYLRFSENPRDPDALGRCLMVPPRYLGKAYLAQVTQHARTHGVDFLEAMKTAPAKRYQRDRAIDFIEVIEEAQTWASPADRLAAIRDLTDYDAWFRRNEADDDDDEALANLAQLAHVAQRFRTVADFLGHAERAAAEAATAEDDPHADHVALMTIHRAKGLEWPTVILPGWIQGVLPHRRSLGDPDALEEERRLAYVAITRARDHLVISAPRTRHNQEEDVSQFLDELQLVDETLAEEG